MRGHAENSAFIYKSEKRSVTGGMLAVETPLQLVDIRQIKPLRCQDPNIAGLLTRETY